MIRLAFTGSDAEAAIYLSLSSRLRGATLAARAGIHSGEADGVSHPNGWSVCAKSLSQLLSHHSDAFDAVVLHVPSDAVRALAEEAVAAGKHVLVNGPIADSAAAGEWVGRLAGGPARVVIGAPWRYVPSVRSIKASLDAGELGLPGLVRIHHWQCAAGFSTPLLDRIHPALDLATWFFGDLPERIHGLCRPEGEDQPDYIQVHLGFAGDGMALIDCAWAMPPGDDYASLSVIGSKGAAYADDHRNMNLLYGGGAPSALRTGDRHRHLAGQLQAFVDSLVESGGGLLSAEEGCRSVALVEAAIHVARQGSCARRRGDHYEFD